VTTILIINVIWQISTLALITLGLAVVFGQLRIMNMAHGEFVMIGAYAPVITHKLTLPGWVAIPICLISVGVIALALERTIIRHLYGRMFDSLLATWGIAILLREAVELLFGRGYQSVSSPLPGTFSIAGIDYPIYRLIAMVSIIVGFIVFAVWLRRAMVARQIRAMVGDPSLAQAVGINTAQLSSYSFVFGCCMAGIAGLILSPTTQVSPGMGIDYLVRSFFTLVVGGLGSLQGLLIGSGVIAGTQSIVSTALSQTHGYLAVLTLSILFLWLRPYGIYNSNR